MGVIIYYNLYNMDTKQIIAKAPCCVVHKPRLKANNTFKTLFKIFFLVEKKFKKQTLCELELFSLLCMCWSIPCSISPTYLK